MWEAGLNKQQGFSRLVAARPQRRRSARLQVFYFVMLIIKVHMSGSDPPESDYTALYQYSQSVWKDEVTVVKAVLQ